MGFEKIEAFLGNHIEGFFNKRFASDLEPVELSDGIKKKIRQLCAGTEEGALPNRVIFTLSPADYGRLCAQRVQAELYAETEREIIRSDAVMEGELDLRFCSSDELSRGTFELSLVQAGETEAEESTLVLEAPALAKQETASQHVCRLATLRVLEGPDKEACLEIGEQKIYIGRRDKNDFILTDSNVSRLHAWVAYEQHRHVLYDAQSTNGTLVNNRPVESCRLRDGDKVRMGATLLKYEVI